MENQQSFFNFLRMFDELLNRVRPGIRNIPTNYRKALEPGLKRSITIRHLVSGDKYPTLQYAFRFLVIPEVCQVIVRSNPLSNNTG